MLIACGIGRWKYNNAVAGAQATQFRSIVEALSASVKPRIETDDKTDFTGHPQHYFPMIGIHRVDLEYQRIPYLLVKPSDFDEYELLQAIISSSTTIIDINEL